MGFWGHDIMDGDTQEDILCDFIHYRREFKDSQKAFDTVKEQYLDNGYKPDRNIVILALAYIQMKYFKACNQEMYDMALVSIQNEIRSATKWDRPPERLEFLNLFKDYIRLKGFSKNYKTVLQTPTGFIRRLDCLDRLVIPYTMLSTVGYKPLDKFELYFQDNDILIKIVKEDDIEIPKNETLYTMMHYSYSDVEILNPDETWSGDLKAIKLPENEDDNRYELVDRFKTKLHLANTEDTFYLKYRDKWLKGYNEYSYLAEEDYERIYGDSVWVCKEELDKMWEQTPYPDDPNIDPNDEVMAKMEARVKEK